MSVSKTTPSILIHTIYALSSSGRRDARARLTLQVLLFVLDLLCSFKAGGRAAALWKPSARWRDPHIYGSANNPPNCSTSPPSSSPVVKVDATTQDQARLLHNRAPERNRTDTSSVVLALTLIPCEYEGI